MNKSLNIRNIIICFTMIGASMLQSCSSDDTYDVTGDPDNKIYIYNQDWKSISTPANFYSFDLVNTPNGISGSVLVKFPSRSIRPVSEAVSVNAELDNSLVELYNDANDSEYLELPEDAINITEATVNMIVNSHISEDSIVVSVNNEKLALLPEGSYLAPIKLASISNPNVAEISSNYNTAYILINITAIDEDNFYSLNMNNSDLYSNFIFPDALAVDLSNYTYEIKCYINEWHTSPSQISRLCSFTAKDESNSNMLRFGEGSSAVNCLQWFCPGGKVFSNTLFNAKQWYTISLTYDGSSFRMFVDGIKDLEFSGSASCIFQRLELGMSWENYPSNQYINGRIAEVRVWNRALSTSELQAGTCSVNPESEGLVAYWKFNEGKGYIFKDATNHGYDMDWSNTWRDNTGNGTLNKFDKSGAVSWIIDVNNICEE